MTKAKKILCVIERAFIKKLIFINQEYYMRKYTAFLKKIGVNFTGEKEVKYIDPSAYFDGTDYSMIFLGENIVISKEVFILTHDYSVTAALCSIGKYIDRGQGELYTLKPVRIGKNSFLGARSFILPGSTIGENCIVGAGTVVKGNIPDGSVVAGNPWKIIGNTKDYANKIMEQGIAQVEM